MLGFGFGSLVCFITWLTSVHYWCTDRDPKMSLHIAFTTAAWGYMCLACGGLLVAWLILGCTLRYSVITTPQYTPIPAAADPVSAPVCGVVVSTQ